MLEISYGVTHSLNCAAAWISTLKTKVNTDQELRRNTYPRLRRNNLKSQGILRYEDYAVTTVIEYDVTRCTRVVLIHDLIYGVTTFWEYDVRKTTKG